jgi:O-antigen/teichoic acid export membrane protein
LLVVSMVGGALGLLFALLAPLVSMDLRVLAQSSGNMLLFALGVSSTSIALVIDQAVVGQLRGDLQLWRNAIFAVVKLIALYIAGIWLTNKLGLAIYATWLSGNVISLAALAGYALVKNGRAVSFWPQWELVKQLGSAALGHHALNLALQAPGLVMPVVVITLMSARMSAYFYTSWMIASFATVAPVALTTVLNAVGAADPTALANKLRLTLKLSVVAGLLASIVLLSGADFILELFGAAYSEQAGSSLRILGLGAFPLIIKSHFVALRRIDGRVISAALFVAAGGVLELLMAATGAGVSGLAGLSLGWVLAICIESSFMVGAVYRVAVPAKSVARRRKNEGGDRLTR